MLNLCQIEVLQGQGKPVSDAVRQSDVTVPRCEDRASSPLVPRPNPAPRSRLIVRDEGLVIMNHAESCFRSIRPIMIFAIMNQCKLLINIYYTP